MPTPEIVTLAEAKKFLRIEDDDDWEDVTLDMLIAAATEAVLSHADAVSSVGAEYPARLKIAVLSRVAITFDQRANVQPGAGEDRLLQPLRTWEL